MDPFLESIAPLRLRVIRFQPVPSRWTAFAKRRDLNWQTQPFTDAVVDKIPTTPGLYCFFIGPPPSTLPPVGYPLYLGRSSILRRRFRQYLREANGGRVRVREFLTTFKGELSFMYTEFKGTPAALVKTETALLDALMPAFSDSGYSAEVRAGRGAWQ